MEVPQLLGVPGLFRFDLCVDFAPQNHALFVCVGGIVEVSMGDTDGQLTLSSSDVSESFCRHKELVVYSPWRTSSARRKRKFSRAYRFCHMYICNVRSLHSGLHTVYTSLRSSLRKESIFRSRLSHTSSSSATPLSWRCAWTGRNKPSANVWVCQTGNAECAVNVDALHRGFSFPTPY